MESSYDGQKVAISWIAVKTVAKPRSLIFFFGKIVSWPQAFFFFLAVNFGFTLDNVQYCDDKLGLSSGGVHAESRQKMD